MYIAMNVIKKQKPPIIIDGFVPLSTLTPYGWLVRYLLFKYIQFLYKYIKVRKINANLQ